MNIFRIGLAALGLVSVFAMNAVQAEVKLNDTKEIVGSWMLDSVAPGLTKPKIEEKRSWNFKPDGILTVSGFNRHFQREDEQKFNFEVVNGMLKISTFGGGSKPTEYKVYEKNDTSMILQGGLEGFYFFTKK